MATLTASQSIDLSFPEVDLLSSIPKMQVQNSSCLQNLEHIDYLPLYKMLVECLHNSVIHKTQNVHEKYYIFLISTGLHNKIQ